MSAAMLALALFALLGVASAQHDGHMAMAMAPAEPSAPRPFCVEKSSAKNCTDFKLPHPVVQGDLMSLCRAMHFMPACSLYKACRAAAPGADDVTGPWSAKVASTPDVCRRLNLVATVCRHDAGMGGMGGCRANYNDMCADGSAVAMCKAMPGFPQLPTTKALNAAMKTLCTEKDERPGCKGCLFSWNANKTYGDCDLLAAWGDTCKAEPKLPLCANHTKLCAGDADWFFCNGGAVAASAGGWKTLLSAAGVAPAAPAAATPSAAGHMGNGAVAAPKPAAAAGAAAAAGVAAAGAAAAAAAKPCPCPRMFSPVCGDDGKSYNSPCEAKCAGAAVAGEGRCEEKDDAAAPAAAAKPAAGAVAAAKPAAAGVAGAAAAAAKPAAAPKAEAAETKAEVAADKKAAAPAESEPAGAEVADAEAEEEKSVDAPATGGLLKAFGRASGDAQ
ncbi:hypothetical protein Rsub_09014 [Raphidocelis subcapitata]|uniref:Kazal-like domain-containing protein n=1 Tax=Raphidocelis subcapitata TaxID=307507 RepID=A0A2V0PAQ1_9CHLO|nr:hypothetical protein Rsub_09014 [Raphidocelis subcapitata]|eukprot:GBF96934.1 hypothetical protein Rsub_09014 [Raphidocelis subcapitata]